MTQQSIGVRLGFCNQFLVHLRSPAGPVTTMRIVSYFDSFDDEPLSFLCWCTHLRLNSNLQFTSSVVAAMGIIADSCKFVVAVPSLLCWWKDFCCNNCKNTVKLL
jgi:hypothetical protein